MHLQKPDLHTYEQYMSVFQNADELLAQFPKYTEQPNFSPNASKVVDLVAFQKKQEEKKWDEQPEKKDA